MKITPLPTSLRGQSRQGLSWLSILGEFIDNSFDAAAKRVEICFDRKQLTVKDDGIGCPDLRRMFTIGEHRRNATTRLGRYGTGGKDAMVSAGQAVTVISVHKGIKRSVRVDWKRLEGQSEWEVDDPTESATEDPSGTKIIVYPLRSDRVKHPSSLIANLSQTYAPAMKEGRQIIFQANSRTEAIAVPQYSLPLLEEEMSAELQVAGKIVRVRMGLIPENRPHTENGLIVSLGFRVIQTGQTIGLGDEPTPGLCGWIELPESWEVTKNKGSILTTEALDRAIYERFRPLIERATKRSQAIAFEGVADEVNRLLADLLDDRESGGKGNHRRKEKRLSPHNETGAVPPKDTGRRRRAARKVQPGDTFDDIIKQSKGIRVAFDSLGEDGPAWQSRGSNIYLNRDMYPVKGAENNKRLLAVHAIDIASQYLVLVRQVNDLPCMREGEKDYEQVARVAGHLLSHLDPQLRIVAEAEAS